MEFHPNASAPVKAKQQSLAKTALVSRKGSGDVQQRVHSASHERYSSAGDALKSSKEEQKLQPVSKVNSSTNQVSAKQKVTLPSSQ